MGYQVIRTIDLETGEVTEREPTAEEIQALLDANIEMTWQVVRSKRDRLLKESDWTVLSDTPTNTAAWKTYRQALRDLPSTTNDPHQVVWPTPPA